jgi:hypothetical protein
MFTKASQIYKAGKAEVKQSEDGIEKNYNI